MTTRRNALGLMVSFVVATACSGAGSGASSGATAAGATATGSVAASGAAPSPVSGGGAVALGDDLCGLLGPGDFTAVGVAGTATAKENNTDANNVYCVYAGNSAGTGGVEFDAFLAGSTADSEASFTSASAPMLDFAGIAKAAFPDADGAALRTDIPGPYAGIALWKGKLVFDIGIPTSDGAKDQLIALAKIVLERAKGLT
jgi:hypothetical protein